MSVRVGSFGRRRTAAVVAVLGLLVVLFSVVQDQPAGAAGGPHPLSETPGSKKAILFSPYADVPAAATDLGVVTAQVELQHYVVTEMTNLNGMATAANFKTVLSNPRGILFVVGHGADDFLGVQVYATAAKCTTGLDNYVTAGTFKAGEITCSGDLLGITGKGIKAYYKDSNTIVYMTACVSASLFASFTNVRDIVGYSDCVSMATGTANGRKFWGRMSGTVDDGASRWATVAGGKGDYGALWRYQHRADTLDTELSPSVKQVLPVAGTTYVVPQAVDGTVIFDAKMDTAVAPAAVVTVSGCEATINNPAWATTADGFNALDFSLQLNAPGTATITVQAASATAARDFKNTLDGNTEPAGTDAVGPNGDNYRWKVKCQAPATTTTSASTTTTAPSTTTTTTEPSTTTTSTTVAPAGPTCVVTALIAGPPEQEQVTVTDTGSGLASITNIEITNGTVSVAPFTPGTTGPVVVTATKTDQTMQTVWSFDATNVAGVTTHCA